MLISNVSCLLVLVEHLVYFVDECAYLQDLSSFVAVFDYLLHACLVYTLVCRGLHVY